MADAKFSVTFKDRQGQLWTARGDTFDEFLTNSGDMRNHLFDGETLTTQQAVANVEAALSSSQSAPVDTRHNGQELQGTTQFEACNICGGPKNKWVPPGVSKSSGKAYSGFFGCPVDHRS